MPTDSYSYTIDKDEKNYSLADMETFCALAASKAMEACREALLAGSKDMPPEFGEFVNREFWNLLGKVDLNQRSGPNSESYIARRGAFARAIEACQELIRDYEAHKDADGNVTGPDYYFHEIDALKTAIVRIECAEAGEPQSPATMYERWFVLGALFVPHLLLLIAYWVGS